MNIQNTELNVSEVKPAQQANQTAFASQADLLTDLHVDERQAVEVKGGPLLFSTIVTESGSKDVMGLPPYK